jgi:hypothetical protein
MYVCMYVVCFLKYYYFGQSNIVLVRLFHILTVGGGYCTGLIYRSEPEPLRNTALSLSKLNGTCGSGSATLFSGRYFKCLNFRSCRYSTRNRKMRHYSIAVLRCGHGSTEITRLLAVPAPAPAALHNRQ